MNLIRLTALNMILLASGLMKLTPLHKWLPIASLALLCAATQAQDQSGAAYALGELPDYTFNLTRAPENPGHYSLVISDSDEHVISSAVSISQLESLKTVLLEAQKFALTEEEIGASQPQTTRFQDQNEAAFLVDVEKFRNQSRLFLTLTADGSSQTAEAGRINRSTRRESGFIFDLLSRLQTMFPKAVPKSGPPKSGPAKSGSAKTLPRSASQNRFSKPPVKSQS